MLHLCSQKGSRESPSRTGGDESSLTENTLHSRYEAYGPEHKDRPARQREKLSRRWMFKRSVAGCNDRVCVKFGTWLRSRGDVDQRTFQARIMVFHTIANARTGKVPNALTFGGTAKKRKPEFGSCSRPVMCSTMGISAPSSVLCTGRVLPRVSSML